MSGLALTKTEDALWRDLYEHVRHLPHGTTLRYRELDSYAPSGDIRSQRWIIQRVGKELRAFDQRVLVNVRAVGYRIAEPEENLKVAHQHRLRGKRQVHKALTAVQATDMDKITDPEVRRQIESMGERMASMESRLVYNERKTAKVEALVKDETRTRKESEAKTDERLERLEALVSGLVPTE